MDSSAPINFILNTKIMVQIEICSEDLAEHIDTRQLRQIFSKGFVAQDVAKKSTPTSKIFFEGELKMRSGFFFKKKIFVRLIVGEPSMYWIDFTKI